MYDIVVLKTWCEINDSTLQNSTIERDLEVRLRIAIFSFKLHYQGRGIFSKNFQACLMPIGEIASSWYTVSSKSVEIENKKAICSLLADRNHIFLSNLL